MFHGVLTLLTRALKADARLRRAHALRAGSTAVIFVFLIVAHASSGGVGSPGLRFFALISWLNLALITLAGSSFFATAITEEKEEGTLGLLQLAGVSTLGLLLGKSTARLIAALLVFLTQLPFAMLAISLGGVTARQIIAVDVALAAYMVMLANVALLCSVAARRSGMACAVMVLLLLWLLAGVHLGDRCVNSLVALGYVSADAPLIGVIDRMFEFLQRVSIVTRIQHILELDFDGSLLTGQVVLHAAMAVAAFCVAWLTFEHFTRYADVSSPARGLLPKINSRWACLIERPWKRALVWKDYHFLTGGHTLALTKLIGYPLLLWLMYEYRDPLRQIAGMPFGLFSRQAMFVALGCEMGLYAARLFHEEMKWGTLPNLLLLPRSLASIAAGKVAGCLLGLLPGFVALCGLHVFLWQEIAAYHITAEQTGWFARTFDLLLFLRTSIVGNLASPEVWMILMQFAVLLHLTVFCSMLVKWGGLALAIAIQLTLNALLAGPMSLVIAGLTTSYNADEVAIAPIIYVGCMLCVVLHFLIGWQVRRAAAS
jgi:ABC-type transport system involved in multi-copper enzyme maturation permease subunit